MQNANYNLVKVLLSELDDAWRIKKHYLQDADEFGCADCKKILQKIHDNTEEHVQMLSKELTKHHEDGKFN
jgi:hypothetical protein